MFPVNLDYSGLLQWRSKEWSMSSVVRRKLFERRVRVPSGKAALLLSLFNFYPQILN